MKLRNAQWEVVAPLLPAGKSGEGKRGRPERDNREVIQGILWVLRTGAPWHDMPRRFPSYATCFRRFQSWVQSGVMQKILCVLWDDLRKRGKIRDVEAFIDGTYIPAKKGGTSSAEAVLEEHPSSWQWQTAMVFRSLSIFLGEIGMRSASSRTPFETVSLSDSQGNLSETKLTTALLSVRQLRERHAVELIAPIRHRTRTRKQDGRALRRYKRRWKVERLFAWLKRMRRVQTRYEAKAENYLGFVLLGCVMIILRRHF